MIAAGSRRWAIAEGRIPGRSHGPSPQKATHETACWPNTPDEEVSSLIESGVPIVAPCARPDSLQPENALVTTAVSPVPDPPAVTA